MVHRRDNSVILARVVLTAILFIGLGMSFMILILIIGRPWQGQLMTRVILEGAPLTLLVVISTLVELLNKGSFMGLRTITLDGRTPTPKTIVVKNLIKAVEILLFPVTLVALIATGRSFGERLTRTRVVMSWQAANLVYDTGEKAKTDERF